MHICMQSMHTLSCTHMHVTYDKHDKHGCLHVSGHLQFLYMCTSACMHVSHEVFERSNIKKSNRLVRYNIYYFFALVNNQISIL